MNATGPRLAGGAHASAPCKVLGTHSGPLGRITATGRALEVHAVAFAELAEGRLWRVRVFFDLYDAGRQLGVLPRSGSAGERALLRMRGFGLRA